MDWNWKVDETRLDFTLLRWEDLNEQLESLHELIHEYGIAKLEGEFRDGKPHGIVTLYMIGGDVELKCEEGVPSNQLKITFSNGCIYEGAYPLGTGKITFPNGARYEGNTYHCKPHGHGTVYLADGATVSCVWGHGELKGRVRITDPSGKNIDEYDLGC